MSQEMAANGQPNKEGIELTEYLTTTKGQHLEKMMEYEQAATLDSSKSSMLWILFLYSKRRTVTQKS